MWISIILWLLSYFLSSKSGASKGQAALIATGVAAGGYYLSEKGYLDNVLGLKGTAKTTPGDPNQTRSDSTNWAGAFGQIGSTALTQVGETARDWGPVGTVGAVTAGAGLFGDNKKLLLIGGLVLAFIALR